MMAVAAGEPHHELLTYPSVTAGYHPSLPTRSAYVLPINYAAPHHVHVPSAPVPVVPVAYTTGHRVESVYEPVEQHGYQIVY